MHVSNRNDTILFKTRIYVSLRFLEDSNTKISVNIRICSPEFFVIKFPFGIISGVDDGYLETVTKFIDVLMDLSQSHFLVDDIMTKVSVKMGTALIQSNRMGSKILKRE